MKRVRKASFGAKRIPLVGEYALDVTRGCLVRGEEPVHLRPQSYEVLEYLTEHRGRLISKDELIAEVWQGRAVTDDSLVQCLRDVRQALGEAGKQSVKNVRGRGYIFEADPEPDDPSSRERVDDFRDLDQEHRTGPAVDPQRASGGFLRLHRVSAGVTATAIVLLIAAAARWWPDDPLPPARIDSIAVLPFTSEGGDPDADYLADGLTDSLINSLSRVRGLAVRSRGAVSRYRTADIEPRDVAARLSVDAFVSGRIVQRGNDLTLYLALVDGHTGNQLWGEQYVRRLTDLADLQQEMTREISLRVRARLTTVDLRQLARGQTTNADAYQHYLRGRYYAAKSREPDIRRGLGYYRQAVDLDPTYALAWSGMADAYRALAIVGQVPSAEALPQARAAALRALEIDESLVDARVALGWILFFFDWDWSGAERELRKAIEREPANSEAHRAYAHLLSNTGRHDEAIAQARLATELAPLSLITNALEAQFLFYAGRDRDAETRIHKTLELDPDYWVAHNLLGRIHIDRGQFDEAVAALQKARSMAPGSTEPATQLGYALARAGRQADARTVIRDLETIASDRYVPAYSFALIAHGLGHRDEALEQLERSYAAREVQLTFLAIDRRWDPLRPHPRFASIVRRMKLIAHAG